MLYQIAFSVILSRVTSVRFAACCCILIPSYFINIKLSMDDCTSYLWNQSIWSQLLVFQFQMDVSVLEWQHQSTSVSGTLDQPRVVAPSKICGHVRSSRRRWRWAQCRPRSAAPTFGRVVLAGASTPAWCPVYRLCERPQPDVVRSAWAGVASGSRRTWPKMENRLRQIRIAKPSSPVWLVTETFVTKWNQRIPKIRRWQFMWNASNDRSSAFRRVHVSEPYNSTEMTRAL